MGSCLSGRRIQPLGVDFRRASGGQGAVAMDILERVEFAFPKSLPEFQRLSPDDAARAGYLERAAPTGWKTRPALSIRVAQRRRAGAK